MTPMTHSWRKTYAAEELFDPVQKFTIYQCEDDDPPVRITASVKALCNINANFNISFDQLKDRTGKTGKKYKKLGYEIEMIPSGASNEFNVMYKGRKLGSHNARIEFQ